jgi:oligoendopeptidase F
MSKPDSTIPQTADKSLPSIAFEDGVLQPLGDGHDSLLQSLRAFVEGKGRDTLPDLEHCSEDEFLSFLQEFDAFLADGVQLKSLAYLAFALNGRDEELAAQWDVVAELFRKLQLIRTLVAVRLAGIGEQGLHDLNSALSQAGYGRFLRRLLPKQQFLLSEDEEVLLSAMEGSAQQSWCTLYDKTIAALSVGDAALPLASAAALLHHPQRDVRRRAAEDIGAALEAKLPIFSHILNTLMAGRHAEDEARGRHSWLQARALENECSMADIHAMTGAVEQQHELFQRYHHLKRRLLGLDRLMDYDRYAPVVAQGSYSWDAALHFTGRGLAMLGEDAGQLPEQLMRDRRVDAAPRSGKAAGAFVLSGGRNTAPFVVLNFNGSLRDVLVTAHEFGHALHMSAYKRRPMLNHDVSPILAETAAILAEHLVFYEILAAAKDGRERLGCICRKLEDSFMTIFRQTALHHVEDAFHKSSRSRNKGLGSENFSRLWRKPQEQQAGDSLHFGKHYEHGWAGIMHFFHLPGYVHGYAMAECLAITLLERMKKDPEAFRVSYAELLEAGAEASPQDLASMFSVDPSDSRVYAAALDSLDMLLQEAEDIADAEGLLHD